MRSWICYLRSVLKGGKDHTQEDTPVYNALYVKISREKEWSHGQLRTGVHRI